MNLSTSTNESKKWYFRIIENKMLCQSSIIYDYSKDIIIDSQYTSLYNEDNNNYNLILKKKII